MNPGTETLLQTLLTRFTSLETSQSLLLSQISTQTATINSLITQVRTLETTVHQQAHQNTTTLVNKFNKLSNVWTTFNTRLTHLPNELVAKILVFIPTLQALDLRRICKHFNLTILTRQFAVLNLAIHPMDLDTGLNNWLRLPKAFQEILAEQHALSLSTTNQKSSKLMEWPSMNRIPHWAQDNVFKRTYLRVVHLVGVQNAPFYDKRIPEGLANLVNLISLDLSHNMLHGQIPVELFGLLQLRELNLGNNELCSEIPREIGMLTNLVVLSLEDNHFFGEIPDEIRNLTMLETLHLHSNKLVGELPAALWTLTRLESLCLTINKFSGDISPNIRNLQNLRFLNLSMLNVRWPFEFQKEDFPVLEKFYIHNVRNPNFNLF